MPVLSNGRYDLGQITLWRSRKQGVAGKDFWDMENKRLQAEKREIELQEMQGKLIKVVTLEALLAPRAMAYRQGIVALQRTLPPRLARCMSLREMEAVIAQAGRELLANVLRPLTLPSGQVLAWEAPEAK
jgi:hypothetical protein